MTTFNVILNINKMPGDSMSWFSLYLEKHQCCCEKKYLHVGENIKLKISGAPKRLKPPFLDTFHSELLQKYDN